MVIIVTILNGIFICLPSLNIPTYRLILFLSRCITLLYTLYFFIIFLPFIPLAFITFVLGIGLVLFTPIFLLFIHVSELAKDIRYLDNKYKKSFFLPLGFLAIFLIPSIITLIYYQDRRDFYKTLDFIYTPDFSERYNISYTNRFNISKLTETPRGEFYKATPFFSWYYKYIVTDNLRLSSEKTEQISAIKSGYKYYYTSRKKPSINNEKIAITDLKFNSRYDERQNIWISQIDLSIKNINGSIMNQEYSTIFTLPTGCWISDYYLDVEDVREKGILTDKKAAMWIYGQIRNENRDPGILYYYTDNIVQFKVFPISYQETRYTGFELIHKEPIIFTIDNYNLKLGDSQPKDFVNTIPIDNGEIIYISSEAKKILETSQPIPYFYFIVDASVHAKENIESIVKNVNSVFDNCNLYSESTKITFVGSDMKTLDLRYPTWIEEFEKEKFEHGFFLDRALKTELFNHHQNPDGSYPIFFVITENYDEAIIFNDLHDYKFMYPEKNSFYLVQNEKFLEVPMFEGDFTVRDTLQTIENATIRRWTDGNRVIYLRDNDEPDILIFSKDKTLTSSHEMNKWETAMFMQAQWMKLKEHPETTQKETGKLIQKSFETGIMTPLTSYLVVENESQKRMLLKKQKETLKGNAVLDAEEFTGMSEPDLYILLLLLIIGLYLKKISRNGKFLNLQKEC